MQRAGLRLRKFRACRKKRQGSSGEHTDRRPNPPIKREMQEKERKVVGGGKMPLLINMARTRLTGKGVVKKNTQVGREHLARGRKNHAAVSTY